MFSFGRDWSLANVIVEWLMGHDIGIAKYYLDDNIKQEYSIREL